jgi:primosomal protein N' (replication factor Y)
MDVRLGQAVLAPFAGRDLVGYVMAVESGEPGSGYRGTLKPLRAVARADPLFGPDFPELARAVSEYYHYPLGLCVREILPGGIAPKVVKEAALTEAGALAAADTALGESDPLRALLAARPSPVPLSSFKNKGDAARVASLAAKGLVRILYSVAKKGTAFAYETLLSRAPGAPEGPEGLPRLGQRERELWERLENVPPTPMQHFRTVFKDPARLAKSLEAKGLVRLDRVRINRDDPGRAPELPHRPAETLTGEQETALAAVLEALDKVLEPPADPGREGPRDFPGASAAPASPGQAAGQRRAAPCGNPAGPLPEAAAERQAPGRFLLFGVTGSGKTEVYLRAARRALERGGGVLWLAPEIALTLGLEARIKASLPDVPLAVLHSQLSAGERHDHWMSLAQGRVRLALGARSAVFAPVRDLRLVIVDEEHDWAYKQDDGLRYHGRDVASFRARGCGAVLILGSATPSLESYRAAEEGRLRLLVLRERPGEARLPKVRIADRRNSPKGGRILGPDLRNELLAAFHRGEQALLFVNRRGWASLPLCLACGHALKCPGCSLNLTLHGPLGPAIEGADEERIRGIPEGAVLVCHGCGWRGRPLLVCPQCGAGMVRYLGAGTERLLERAEKDFKVKGLRLDADSSRAKGGLKSVLESFGKGEASFLVGTQMAAKGHDFPNLTLVGVVDADIGLNLPDFRAAERTFQLLSQVAGRAGRAEKPGKVIIQTHNPGHYSVAAAKAHDYLAFYRSEASLRREMGLPPFGRLALMRFTGADEARTEAAAGKAAAALRSLVAGRAEGGFRLFGPAPSPVGRLKERWRFQMMLRADTARARGEILRAFIPLCRKGLPKSVAFSLDVDPYHLM